VSIEGFKREGTTIRLYPALTHHDEAMTLSVLIDGGEPRLAPPVATLANVRFRALDPTRTRRESRRQWSGR
jgi:hypothetical protein